MTQQKTTTRRKKESLTDLRLSFYQEIDAGHLDFSTTLKRMRKLVQKTQDEFAHWVDVAPGVIKAIEQRKANPTVETLEKIGSPFGLTIRFQRKNRTE